MWEARRAPCRPAAETASVVDPLAGDQPDAAAAPVGEHPPSIDFFSRPSRLDGTAAGRASAPWAQPGGARETPLVIMLQPSIPKAAGALRRSPSGKLRLQEGRPPHVRAALTVRQSSQSAGRTANVPSELRDTASRNRKGGLGQRTAPLAETAPPGAVPHDTNRKSWRFRPLGAQVAAAKICRSTGSGSGPP